MRASTIVQARMGSSRLPGKVLMDLGGKPALLRVLERVRESGVAGTVVVATSTNTQDDEIASFCRRESVPVFRGSETDVLDRYRQCARLFPGDVIVRVTADCPLLSPDLLRSTVVRQEAAGNDYTIVDRLPRGIPAEALSPDALEASWRDAKKPEEREHVVPFLLNHREKFRLEFMAAPAALARPDLRFTLDTAEDYQLLSRIYNHWGDVIHRTPLEEIIDWVERQEPLKTWARERPC